MDWVSWDGNTRMDMPEDVTKRNDLRTMRQLYHGDAEANLGRMSQLCVILAIRDLRAKDVETLEQEAFGKVGGVDTRDFTPNRGGIGPWFFVVQHLWPDKDRDPQQLLREIQYLIIHGAGLLKGMRGGNILEALIDILTHEEEE